jgi:hypothetical protein
MIFFKRHRRDDPFINDELGEWLLINNKYLAVFSKYLDKISKLENVKIKEKYIISYNNFEYMKNILSIKGLFIINQNIGKINFEKSLNYDQNISTSVNILEKIKICNEYYIFYDIDTIIKNIKNYNIYSKVLIPPLGINNNEIPLEINQLFKIMIESVVKTTCEDTLFDIDASNLITKITSICRNYNFNINELDFYIIFSYFSRNYKNIKINFKRINLNSIEINILIPEFKMKSLIPLVWSNITRIPISC